VCARFEGTVLSASLEPCTPGDAPVVKASGLALDALVEADVTARDGSVQRIRATHSPVTGNVELESGSARATLSSAGAQLAIADLDGDGDAEILWTTDALPATGPGATPDRAEQPDALIISAWHPGSNPTERARIAVPTGVRAVAACPPDAAGPAKVVLTTPGELWVVH
jgi:hypothetical protein